MDRLTSAIQNLLRQRVAVYNMDQETLGLVRTTQSKMEQFGKQMEETIKVS